MKKIVYIFIVIIVFVAGIGIGIYARNKTLNPRAAFPSFLSDPSVFFLNKGVGIEQDLLYHDVDIVDFIENGSKKTKVAVEGIVEIVTAEPDGDAHVVVKSNIGSALVTEFIPEIKSLNLPAVGEKIRIWGISRFDEPHNWWEIHPVIGWEKMQ